MEEFASFAMGIRGAERVMIVIFAGLAIYFGYRLFLNLPLQNNQKGEIEMPGIKVVMARVGPGVFFAGFGTVILVSSYMNPIEIITPDIEIRGEFNTDTPAPKMGALPTLNTEPVNEQDRSRAILAVQIINCLPGYAKKANSPLLPDDINIAARDAKVSLLQSVWYEDKWGDFSEFTAWTRSGSGNPKQEIVQIYMDKTSC